jgi:hypothetical protein
MIHSIRRFLRQHLCIERNPHWHADGKPIYFPPALFAFSLLIPSVFSLALWVEIQKTITLLLLQA